MEYKSLILTREEGVATVTLNRPEKLNAITHEMLDELSQAVKELTESDEVKVAVVTGAGRAFCSGTDLSGLSNGLNPIDFWKFTAPKITRTVMSLRGIPKPTIAAVNGVAVGAGCSLALACDIIMASDQARFGQVFVLCGLQPDYGATYFLPRAVGVAKACELALTGKIIDANEADKPGLVNGVVPADRLKSEVEQLARDMAKLPPLAIRMTKLSLYQGLEGDLPQALEREAQAQSILIGTEDFQEGVAAFLEKREPVFRGR